jgi:hypothetical protein
MNKIILAINALRKDNKIKIAGSSKLLPDGIFTVTFLIAPFVKAMAEYKTKGAIDDQIIFFSRQSKLDQLEGKEVVPNIRIPAVFQPVQGDKFEHKLTATEQLLTELEKFSGDEIVTKIEVSTRQVEGQNNQKYSVNDFKFIAVSDSNTAETDIFGG